MRSLNSKPGFLKHLAYMQWFGIIMVVLGHSFHEYPDGILGGSLWIHRLIYNVHMPLFFFVSGYLLYYTSFRPGKATKNTGSFIYGKFKRLVVPFLFLSLITYIPRVFLSNIADDAVEFNLTEFINRLIYANYLVIPYFWFLYTNFIILVASFVVLKYIGSKEKYRRLTIYVLLLISTILPLANYSWTSIFAISYIVVFGMYFILGILYCRNAERIDKALRLTNPLTCVLLFAVWITGFFITEGHPVGRLFSVIGILAFLSLCQIISRRDNRFMDMFIGANYLIFLLSWYVNVLTQQALSHFVTMHWAFFTLLSFFGGIIIPWLCYVYLKANPGSIPTRLAVALLGQDIKTEPKRAEKKLSVEA